MEKFVRTLTKKDGLKVEVIVSAPVQDTENNGDWQCTYQIVGLGDSKIRFCYGVDAIQAIYLALKYVATTLYMSDEYERGDLMWGGNYDLGLPTAETIREDIAKKMARLGRTV